MDHDHSDNGEHGVDGADIPVIPGLSPSRRSFLKLVGFSFVGAALPGCSAGQEHDAVPFLDKPEDVTPGVTAMYATGCGGCEAACGLLAKVRDGRPIKLEGNDRHPLSLGRTCAVGQAQVLSLYDSERLAEPLASGQPSTWSSVDGQIREALDRVRRSGGAVRILTGTLSGPTERAAIERFVAAFPGARHVSYDALSCSALVAAHEALYGERILPHYRLEHARAIVSVGADFLGTWISPVEFTRDYQKARTLNPGGTFCHHVQIESHLSLTGANADRRVRARPVDLPAAVFAIGDRVAKAKGVKAPWGSVTGPDGIDPGLLDDAAQQLVEAPKGRGLVLCGLDDEPAQRAAAWINHTLGSDDSTNASRTVDLDRPSHQADGNDRALAELVGEIEAGSVDALLVMGCNPVFDLPNGEALGKALDQIDLVVSFSERIDETSTHAGFVCPDHHALEAWRDAEPTAGLFTLSQPTIRPIMNTRAFVESLSTFFETARPEYEQVREIWRERVLTGAGTPPFELAWAKALDDGYFDLGSEAARTRTFKRGAAIGTPAAPAAIPEGALAVVLYPSVAIRDGRHAHNPWLLELPDPISKVSWENYAAMSPHTAERLGVEDGTVVRLETPAGEGETTTLDLPVAVQPGQADETVAVAVGFGRLGTDRFARVGPEWIQGQPTVEPGQTIGVNAAPLGAAAYVTVKRTGKQVELARTQIYDSLRVPKHLAPKGGEVRPHVQSTTFAAYARDPGAGAPHAHVFDNELWPDDHPETGHHWGLAVDLSACTGCAACVIACQSENNIPVVGKDEVRRQREMHWLRVDRFYAGADDDLQVANQPMMCQQCDHAPCETVCPVLATVHSNEGLNQQVYNRCVGTRYCSNNCPYKVRRFNWFDYSREDKLQNLALNPDVTVRTRGVMEKCSFCVQRIQDAKAVAAREGRDVADGDIQTACMQVCPANAIVFGDTNDAGSEVTDMSTSPRAYRVLDELGVKPSVAYLRQVKDRDAPANGHDEEPHHG